jgi:hypothetical protein
MPLAVWVRWYLMANPQLPLSRRPIRHRNVAAIFRPANLRCCGLIHTPRPQRLQEFPCLESVSPSDG